MKSTKVEIVKIGTCPKCKGQLTYIVILDEIICDTCNYHIEEVKSKRIKYACIRGIYTV